MITSAHQRLIVVFVCGFLLSFSASLIAADKTFLVSPEIKTKGRVTFRFAGETSEKVSVVVDGQLPIKMNRNSEGVWQATSQELSPGIYDYHFEVDGAVVTDPLNRWIKQWLVCKSMFEIPGDPAPLTQQQAVPHGVVHRHVYPSKSVGGDRAAIVYTPPKYDRRRETAYPMLILCHGFGDDETAWTEVGRAHLIIDNLISQNQVEPVVVVMPNGHPVEHESGHWSENYGNQNIELMIKDLAGDLLPMIRHNYHIRVDSAGRAIAGLSMGGGHAIHTMMSHPEQFDFVGAFSAAAPQGNLASSEAQWVSRSQANNARRKLLWIACGRDDFLLDRNRKFIDKLKKHDVDHTFVETDGGHSWKAWREYLPQFLKLAFPASEQ